MPSTMLHSVLQFGWVPCIFSMLFPDTFTHAQPILSSILHDNINLVGHPGCNPRASGRNIKIMEIPVGRRTDRSHRKISSTVRLLNCTFSTPIKTVSQTGTILPVSFKGFQGTVPFWRKVAAFKPFCVFMHCNSSCHITVSR